MNKGHKPKKLKLWRVGINFFLPLSKSWKGRVTPKGYATITVRCYTKDEANDLAKNYIFEGRIGKIPYRGKITDLDTIITLKEIP